MGSNISNFLTISVYFCGRRAIGQCRRWC